MDIKLCALGGYSEVGKNMTAVKVGNESVILDMGFYLPALVTFEEEGHSRQNLSPTQMIKLGAIPDDRPIESWKSSVKAIVCSHAHLDHIGAVPWLAGKYKAPVLGTPFTMEVLRNMMHDDRMQIPNPIRNLATNARYKVSKDLEIEFINTTHSTPQTVMIALHTKKGVVLYTNDFKFDNHPVIGKKTNYERLKELKDEGVKAVVIDSLYSGNPQKTPSEKIARELLRDVMLGTENQGNPMIVTCFSSHIARLKSIVEFGKKLNRKIVFLGRSLNKYSHAAAQVNIIDFSKEAEIIGYSEKIKKFFARIKKENMSKYLIVCTGGQGEQNSVLNKMINGTFNFKFCSEDTMIFSNRTIPVSPNIENRERLEKKLRNHGVRLYKDIHVSGHGAREDIRDLINMVDPEHIIPSHGPKKLTQPAEELANEMGFKSGKSVHMMKNGKTLTF